jgi:hypothetical protein
MTIVEFDEGLGDGEAEAEAAVASGDKVASLFEGVEEAVELVGLDADAGVLDVEEERRLGVGVGGVGGADVDATVLGGEFGGIFDEVPEHLLEAGVVGEDVVVRGVEVEVELLVFGVNFGAEDFDDGADGGVDVDGFEHELEFALGDAGEVEEVVNKAGLELDVSADDLDIGEEGGWKVGGAFEKLGGGEDGSEGRAELMAEGGEEAVLGLIGIFGLAAGGVFGGEKAFAFFECLALVVDVGAGAKPFEDAAGIVADGNAAGFEPAVGAIGAAEAVFDIVRGAALDGGGPSGGGAGAVIGVHHAIEPLESELLIVGKAGVIDPLLAEEVAVAIGIGRPDELGESLGHASVVFFALTEKFGLGGGVAVAGLGEDAVDRLREVTEVVASLGDDVGDAGAKGLDDFGFVAEAGDEDGGDVDGGSAAGAEVAEEIKSGAGGVELVVEDEQIGWRGRFIEDAGGVGGGECGGDTVASAFEGAAGEADDAFVIIEDQDVGGGIRHQLFPWPLGGSLTTCRKNPRRRMASMKASYSTGLVM